MNDEIRLNKYLSASGFCSRRKADELIAQGKVRVNDYLADMGMKVSKQDKVYVEGKQIQGEQPFKMVAFYKPRGYTCTSYRGDTTGIFKNFDLEKDLKYIGRLDKDSEGLLLLTNDGNLGNTISKARNGHEKEYIVTVNKPITDDFLKQMSEGVKIFDSNKEQWVITRPCTIWKKNERTFHIILTQGLNRQIRRMCEVFSYKVVKLKRIRVMNIELGQMKQGEIREITADELTQLQKMLQSDEKRKKEE